MTGDKTERTGGPGLWVLLGILVAGGIAAAIWQWRGDPATSREQEAEQRAASLRDQSIKESPTPVTPEVVVDPAAPPTRGPMGSPPRR